MMRIAEPTDKEVQEKIVLAVNLFSDTIIRGIEDILGKYA